MKNKSFRGPCTINPDFTFILLTTVSKQQFLVLLSFSLDFHKYYIRDTMDKGKLQRGPGTHCHFFFLLRCVVKCQSWITRLVDEGSILKVGPHISKKGHHFKLKIGIEHAPCASVPTVIP